MMDNKLKVAGALALGAVLYACTAPAPPAGGRATPVKDTAASAELAEIRAIAKDAYIYGYPVVDNYRFTYARAVDTTDGMYGAPINTFGHDQDVKKAGEKAVQTVNADTPYSRAVIDLRSEPVVLTAPRIEKNRYFTMQFVDMYTHNFAYVGSRTTGNDGGSFLITGPGWKGEAPKGVKAVIPCETELMTLIGRTQLFNPADLPNVKKIQAGYTLRPLSQFLKQPAPPAAPAIRWLMPLKSADELRTSLEFFNQLNYALGFCPPHPTETELMARFAKIGVGAGKRFDPAALSPEKRQAFEEGVKDAWKEFGALSKRAAAGEVTSGDVFGTREQLKNNYLYRWAGDLMGIYGNTQAEAIYPGYQVGSDGKPLDASTGCYTLRFEPGKLPPANAFWSVTMYDEPDKLLVPNPIERHLINSPMLPKLRKDKDGGLTLYLQADSPGKDKESNWLPAPKGPFFAVLRIYWPKPEALDGTWKQPPLVKVP
jgi:hypothetical protein